MPVWRPSSSWLLLLSILFFGQTPRGVVIRGFEVNGLTRLNAAQVVAISGLKDGQVFDTAAMDGAIARLVGTGVFANVACRYDGPRGGLVVFDIREHPWTVPVLFDNFIWWSDEDLVKAIATALPTFDGRAPQTDVVVKVITSVLDRLVREKNAGAHVEYLPGMQLGGTDNTIRQHRFQIKGVPLPVCAVHFPQSKNVPEGDLTTAARTLVGAEYWRQSLNGVVKDTLLPLYFQRGFVRARLTAPPEVRYISTSTCPSGVDVSITIEEGARFVMNGLVWSGNSAVPSKALDGLLTLKNGAIVDRNKVDAAVAAGKDLYLKQGYLEAQFKTDEVADETAGRMGYRVTIAEGSQYFMGTLNLPGFTPADAKKLQQAWKLASGKPYDKGYLPSFMRLPAVGGVMRSALPLRATVTETRTPANRTVDVTIALK